MSDPNQATKKRQLMLVGGTLTAVAVLGIVGSLVLDDGSPTSTKRQTKPTTINIAAPGTVDDKDVWRANEGAKGVQNETMLKELRDQMNAQKAELERLKVEQGRAKNGTPNGTPVAVAATNTADVTDALAKPLPGAPGQPQAAARARSADAGCAPPLRGLRRARTATGRARAAAASGQLSGHHRCVAVAHPPRRGLNI